MHIVVLGLPLLVELEFGNVGWFVGFPFNKNSGLKFRKLHVLNGTVHSGCTDPTQATARLVIGLESRIQKSGTAWGQQFCQRKGTFRSDRLKWPDRSEWTTFKVGPENFGRTKPKWSVPFDVPTEMSAILIWMESALGCMVLCWVVVWRLDCFGKQPLIFIGYYDVARKKESESVPWKQTHSAIRHNTDPVPSRNSKRAKRTEVTYSEIRISQWPLCVLASNEQISPPSLVCEQNSLHLLSLCTRILFKTIGHFRVSRTLTFKMRPSAQPVLWKWVLFAWEWKSFPYQRLST